MAAEQQVELIVETQPNITGVRGDLNYKLIIMRQIDRCGYILGRTPHEINIPNSSILQGCSYQDIARSFEDSVRLLEQLLTPYYDVEFTRKKEELIKNYKEEIIDNLAPKDEAYSKLHSHFFLRYGNAILLCCRLGMLLEEIGEGTV